MPMGLVCTFCQTRAGFLLFFQFRKAVKIKLVTGRKSSRQLTVKLTVSGQQ